MYSSLQFTNDVRCSSLYSLLVLEQVWRSVRAWRYAERETRIDSVRGNDFPVVIQGHESSLIYLSLFFFFFGPRFRLGTAGRLLLYLLRRDLYSQRL